MKLIESIKSDVKADFKLIFIYLGSGHDIDVPISSES